MPNFSIFDENVEAIVNPVNCVGVAGKGLALEFKKRYPKNFEEYRNACFKGEVNVGEMFITKTGTKTPKFIINFPTKKHWKFQSEFVWIKEGLIDLFDKCIDLQINSLAIPAIGCGLGGLNWDIVNKEINLVFLNKEKELNKGFRIKIFGPDYSNYSNLSYKKNEINIFDRI